VEVGHDELAKGIFQIWRHVSHARRGLLPSNERVSAEAIGAVLTTEPWLTMTHRAYSALLERAEAIVASSNEDIRKEDRIPIGFCPVSDLERLLPHSTFESFASTMRSAACDKNAGWHMNNLHSQFVREGARKKEYAFLHRVAEFLPWYRTSVLYQPNVSWSWGSISKSGGT
jgi:hypothetical protein